MAPFSLWFDKLSFLRGLEFEMNPVAFTVAGKPIAWYGIVICLGMILAYLISSRKATKHEGFTSDDFLDYILFTIPLGIVGARAFFVLTNLELYKDFLSMIAVWNGGLAITGGIVFGIAAITLAVSVKLYDILTVSNSIFLNIVAILLTAGAVAFFVMEIADRKRGFARERAALEEANAALFAEAAEIPVPSADALFAAAAESAAAALEEAAAEEQDHFLDVSKELTLPVAMDALTTLATEKGLTPERGTIPALLSAMASSRLLLTRGMDTETFTAMTETLCEYFGCPAVTDVADATYTDEARIKIIGQCIYIDISL